MATIPKRSTFAKTNKNQIVIPFKNSLQKHVVSNDTLVALLDQLSKVPCLSSLKLDIELTLHACKIVETIISLGDTKVDKSTLVISAFGTIFPDLDDNEVVLLKNQIEFVYSNNLITIIVEDTLSGYQRVKNVVSSVFSSSK